MRWDKSKQSTEFEDRTNGSSGSSSGFDLGDILGGALGGSSSSSSSGIDLGDILGGALGGSSSSSGSGIDLGDILGGGSSSSSSSTGIDLGDILGGALGGSTGSTTTKTTGTGIPKMGGILGIIITVVMLFLGGGSGLSNILGGLGSSLGSAVPAVTQTTAQVTSTDQSSDDAVAFPRAVIYDLNTFWGQELPKYNVPFSKPGLVVYSGSTSTSFGRATSDMGPFYAPSEHKIYLDPSFTKDLVSYGAKSAATQNFAMAYVLGHEYGHHVQELIGLSDAMNRIYNQVNEKTYNKYSVALELQADYLAGAWAKWLQTQTIDGQAVLEPGDIPAALEVAAHIGDDSLQKKYQGYVNEESWTHGSSADRQKWFNLGYKYGDLEHSDTFTAMGLQNPIGQMPSK
jgi:predicted metalloprotease